MSRPVCETMTNRPSPNQDGWVQWGLLSGDGQTFTPLYPLEAALPDASAYYFLAAAGVCTVQGQPDAGALLPNEQPQVTPVQGQPPQTESEPPAALIEDAPAMPSESTTVEDTTLPWAWGVGLVLLLIIGGAAFTRARRKQTDPTPPRKTFTFNKGADDADR